ncbi:MAG: hypothetical protein FJX56_07455 [Alphaproteobacteria bacterium]|nr:hypothetical protein [Alphaproteobacteria bacterium]
MTRSASEIIPCPTDLRTKVRPPRPLDPTIFERADAEAATLTPDYLSSVSNSLEGMGRNLARLRSGGGGDPDTLKALFRGAHDIKGHAGSFNYPLLGEVMGSLCHYLRDRPAIDARGVKIVETHMRAAHLVVSRDIKGMGGAKGPELLAELAQLLGADAQHT